MEKGLYQYTLQPLNYRIHDLKLAHRLKDQSKHRKVHIWPYYEASEVKHV